MRGVWRRIASLGVAVLLLLSVVAGVAGQAGPSITVNDQRIVEGIVMIDQVNTEALGWLVIHADDNGSPGAVIGYSAVVEGENKFVEVEVDEAQATETLYAMLHVDEGEAGTFEFPDGDDVPVMVDGQPLTVSFMVQEEVPAEVPPAIELASEEDVMDEVIVIDRVVVAEPAWVVVHADENGAPGSVIGYVPVVPGETTALEVDVDPTDATETLYVMLHRDLGTEGTFEFPGADEPLTMDDEVIVTSFAITDLGMAEEAAVEEETEEVAEAPATLPVAGGTFIPWAGIILMTVGIASVSAATVLLKIRSKR